MTLTMYSHLLVPSFQTFKEIAEPQPQYHMLTERHLQVMWLEQKYFHPLKTSEGLPIEVLSPGIWNSGAGPDFLKAHLKIGERELRGDIELHLADDGWFHHKHHLDSNYNHVILHVSYWTPNREKTLLTANNSKIPRVYLERSLTIPETRIVNLIDLDLYPHSHFSGSGVCANALFRFLTENEISSFFRSAAEWRLSQKQASLAARTVFSEDIVRMGIAMVLGYKQNAEAFSQVFKQITSQNFDSEKKCFAFALGLCGFFEKKYQQRWYQSEYFQELHSIFTTLKSHEMLPKLLIKQTRIRPPSHPVRRLAVLSKVAFDNSLISIGSKLLQLWKDSWHGLNKRKSLIYFRQQLDALLPSYRDSYWELHYAFELKAQTKPLALMGEDLKQEIMVNILLPLLYGYIQNNLNELDTFKQLYATYKSPKTQKSSYLVHRFFGNSSFGNLLKRTELQQGAYQLHKDFYLHFEASCHGCPFVSRYREIINRN